MIYRTLYERIQPVLHRHRRSIDSPEIVEEEKEERVMDAFDEAYERARNRGWED
jgi:hypothetical protein